MSRDTTMTHFKPRSLQETSKAKRKKTSKSPEARSPKRARRRKRKSNNSQGAQKSADKEKAAPQAAPVQAESENDVEILAEKDPNEIEVVEKLDEVEVPEVAKKKADPVVVVDLSDNDDNASTTSSSSSSDTPAPPPAFRSPRKEIDKNGRAKLNGIIKASLYCQMKRHGLLGNETEQAKGKASSSNQTNQKPQEVPAAAGTETKAGECFNF